MLRESQIRLCSTCANLATVIFSRPEAIFIRAYQYLIVQQNKKKIKCTINFILPSFHQDKVQSSKYRVFQRCTQPVNLLIVCFYHVTYAFRSESTLYSCLTFLTFLHIQVTIECGFTLKRVRGMIRTYSQMHRTYKYSQHSSIIQTVWLNG